MKKKTNLVIIFVLGLFLFYPLTAGAEQKQAVSVKEIAGEWSLEAVAVGATFGLWQDVERTATFTFQEDGSGKGNLSGLKIPLTYQDGIISGELSGGSSNSFEGTAIRAGDQVVIEGEWLIVTVDSDRIVYKLRGQKKVPPPENGIPVLTGPQEEKGEGEKEGEGRLPPEKESIPGIESLPEAGEEPSGGHEPDAPAPRDEDDYDWNWVDCDCEKEPWEEHAGPLTTAVISVIAAVAAALGGSLGSAGGVIAGGAGGAAGTPAGGAMAPGAEAPSWGSLEPVPSGEIAGEPGEPGTGAPPWDPLEPLPSEGSGADAGTDAGPDPIPETDLPGTGEEAGTAEPTWDPLEPVPGDGPGEPQPAEPGEPGPQAGPESGTEPEQEQEEEESGTEEPGEESDKEPEEDPEEPEEKPEEPEEEPEDPEDELPPPLTPHEIEQLMAKMAQVIAEKIDEGYFVRNSNIVKKAFWNLPLGWIVEWNRNTTSGQCGEFGEWGAQWSKDFVEEIVGEGAIVTTIAMERNTFKNHRATKVIMPNGERFVFDYWEGMDNYEPRVYTEKEWIDKWGKELGGNAQVCERSLQELSLKQSIEQFGEKKGIEIFRRQAAKDPKGAQEAESVIKSYRRAPW